MALRTEYSVLNFYKGCQRKKYFTDEKKFRDYIKRQAVLGHTHIEWCKVVYFPSYKQELKICHLGLMPELPKIQG